MLDETLFKNKLSSNNFCFIQHNIYCELVQKEFSSNIASPVTSVKFLHIFPNERILSIYFKTNSKFSTLIQNISLNPILSLIVSSRIIPLKYTVTVPLFIHDLVFLRVGFLSSEPINSDSTTSIRDC